jgi:hypothetical protein
MAYLKKSRHTAYWVLRFRDLETGSWREKSTRLRHDCPKQTRAAHRMAQEATAAEAKVGPTDAGEFREWVMAYLREHYTEAKSLKRYTAAWLRIVDFNNERGIRHPLHVRYEHAADFMTWRKGQGVKHNTARLEIKFYSFILQEALRREYCQKNPLSLALISREPVAQKPDLDLESFRKARAAFAARTTAPWMLTVFEVCAHVGCRFREAEFGPESVDFEKKILWITDSKRDDTDPRKRFGVPLPDTLAEHLRDVFKTRKRTAPDLTHGEQNRQFNITLKGACGATSHSLRVAFITRCHRAGLSESQAMRLTNHSTRLVHLIYSRLSVDDARDAAAKVPPPL